jgi:aspartyl-tRNA(Asn)/glutamyl-tRNA(Gln) amidotransferase subunit A
VVPLSWSLDHLGPLCRNVTDTALMLEAIAGYDPLEPTSVDWPVDRYSAGLDANTSAFRVGVAQHPFFDELDPEIEQAITEALRVIATLTATTVAVDLPPLPTTVVPPEAYAGHKQQLSQTPELYLPWTRQRLEHGANISADAYVLGRRELDRIRRSITSVFADVDIIVTPTTPVQAITVAEAQAMVVPPPPPGELWLRNTRLFNGYALPTISLPCGFTRAGLPIGLQLTGLRFGESRLLAFARAYERASDWQRRPPI